MEALSTRTETTLRRGLLAGLEQLAAFEPRGWLIEPARPEETVRSIVERLSSWGAPVVAISGGLGPSAVVGRDAPSLESEDSEIALSVAGSLLEALASGAPLRCSRLVVPLAGPLESEVGGAADAGSDAVQKRRVVRQREREIVAERLCRRLFALSRRQPAATFLLRASGHPDAAIDVPTLGLVLSEFSGEQVGAVFDVGAAALGASHGGPTLEEWASALDGRVGLVIASDHDGRESSDLIFGSGQLDLDEVGRFVARGTPRVLQPSTEFPLDFLRDASELVASVLGGPRDLV